MRRGLSFPLAVVLVLTAVPLALDAAAADDWQLLGRRQVSFAVDKDVIDVGARDGLFNAIRIEVQDGDLIRRIDFSYRSVRGGRRSRATVHVYGRR